MEEFKAQMSVAMKESKEIKEGTWQVPDSYPKLLGLQKFLKKPHKAKTAKAPEEKGKAANKDTKKK